MYVMLATRLDLGQCVPVVALSGPCFATTGELGFYISATLAGGDMMASWSIE